VASLLKLYLRELPEPVVDHYNYRKVLDATKGMHCCCVFLTITVVAMYYSL